MEKIYVICVEDQREVLNTIVTQLSPFEDYAVIEECERADEALELIEEIETRGDFVGLIISDHVMPGMTGVKFFTQIKEDPRFSFTKKILLTGQATHLDTIEAINQARIDRYIEKPWEAENLTAIVSKLLTEYVIEMGIDYQPYIHILDKQKLFDLLRDR